MSSSRSSAHHHRIQSECTKSISLIVVTVSDTRTKETDKNLHYLEERITHENHTLEGYHLIKDEPAEVEAVLEKCAASNAQVILFNGGTGISQRDRTYDVLSKRLEKTLPGFGEIFRQLSFEDIGPAAMLSRATAGVYKNKMIISVPGSPHAVELAWTKLIAPEIKHLAWELTR